MFNLEKLRLPYREDKVFSLLAFTVFLIPVAFFLLTNENYETAKFSLFLILTGCGLWTFLKRQTLGSLALKINGGFFILLGALLAFAVLSTIFSSDILYSIFGFYYRFTDSLVFYFCLALFIFLLVNVLDKDRLTFLLKILLFDALAVGIVACLQAFAVTYYSGASSGGFVQGPSLLGNPDFSAMFMAAVFPFALVFLLLATKFYAKIYYAFNAFVILLANLVLASRGALLATVLSIFLALALFLVYHFEKKFFFGLLGLIIFCLGFGTFFLGISRPQAVSSIIHSVDLNTTARLVAWQVSIKGLAQHPFLGSGPGTFALFFERARTQTMAGEVGVFDDPHNLFLRIAVAEGAPFVLIFFGLLMAAVYYASKTLSKEKDLLILGCIISLLAWCVGASFNPVPVPMFMLWAVLLSGCLVGHTEERNLSLRVGFRGLAFIFSLIFIVLGVNLIISEYVFGFAKRAYLNGDYKTSYKLSGLAEKVNPTNKLYEVYRIGSGIALSREPEIIIKDINKLILGHKNQAASYVTASNLYNLFFQTTGNKAFLQSAILQMDKALDVDKFYAERYAQEALYFYQLGDVNKAKTALNKSLSIKNDQFPAWILLAKIYQSEGEKIQTIFALTKAFKLRPDIPQLSYLLSLAKNQTNIKLLPIPVVPQRVLLD